MCPLYPFHLILLYLCLLLPLLLAVVEGSEVLAEFKNWNLTFSPRRVSKLQEYNTSEVQIACYNCLKPPSVSDDYMRDLKLAVRTDNADIVSLQHQQHELSEHEIIFDLHNFDMATNWSEIFNISGNFLGFTKIWAEIRRDKEVLVSQVNRNIQ